MDNRVKSIISSYTVFDPDLPYFDITDSPIFAEESLYEEELKRENKMTTTEQISKNLECKDLSAELWREYDFGGRVYRIDFPVKLYTRVGGTTHRVVDVNGLVHCVPAPGERACVLRWLNKDPNNPVNF